MDVIGAKRRQPERYAGPSMSIPVSVFIIALNEADRIARTINSVKDWVDEVIVIDSGSLDGTQALAESLGAKVFSNAWNGYGLQKRFGEDRCRNEWLLNLDADEEVTPELSHEIQKLFVEGMPAADGYIIPVRDMLLGEKHLSRHAHTNNVLRLYSKKRGRFSDSPVHDSVIMQEGARVRQLKAPALHRSFRNLAHAIEKLNAQTDNQSAYLQRRGMKHPYFRLATEFPLAFIKDYFLRLYMLRGWNGFIYSVTYAFTRFMRIAKYIERMKND